MLCGHNSLLNCTFNFLSKKIARAIFLPTTLTRLGLGRKSFQLSPNTHIRCCDRLDRGLGLSSCFRQILTRFQFTPCSQLTAQFVHSRCAQFFDNNSVFHFFLSDFCIDHYSL
jgi:hypothetical protein